MGTPCFEDGIGRRWRSVDPADGEIETLILCRELVEAESTEAALVERASQLAAFSNPAIAPVRRIERTSGAEPRLAVVSPAVPGIRLSEALREAQQRFVAPNLDAACFILAQVTTALADLHRHSRDLSHGAIGPERIVVHPDGRALIVEPVFGPALEALQMGRARLWAEFRVPVPPVAGTARFDQVTDVMQLGVLALALVLGRPIRRDEYPLRLHELMLETSAPGAPADRQALLRSLQAWIHRSLQLEPRSAFRTAAEAAPALEAVLAEGPRHKMSPSAVSRYLAACAGEGEADWKVPSVLSAPCCDDERATERTVGVPWAAASAKADAGNAVCARGPAPVPARSWTPGPPDRQTSPFSRVAAGGGGVSARLAEDLDYTAARRGWRVAVVSLVLIAVFGVSYLGARGFLTLPGVGVGRGTVVLESNPPGIEVFVDGHASGLTPATLDLRAGEHTVVLRAGRGITLVPIVVVAGARRVEHVDIRQRKPAPRAPRPAQPPSLPPPAVPQ